MSEIIYSCHDCHHISAMAVCETCGSARTGLGSHTLKIGRRVSSITQPMALDVHMLTNTPIGYRLARGFSLINRGEKE